jgi:hypothetical protein
MKLSILVFLIIGATLIFFGCSEKNPSAPELSQSDQVTNTLAKKLIGAMELDFNLEWNGEVNVPIWVGTIYFEEHGTYGIKFFHLTPFKEFSQASPFEEVFEIYELGDETVVYLGGPDAGVTTLANKPPEPVKYRMNGEIDVANWPFEEWLGRNVHMSGIITYQFITTPDGPIMVPATAPGTLRIN